MRSAHSDRDSWHRTVDEDSLATEAVSGLCALVGTLALADFRPRGCRRTNLPFRARLQPCACGQPHLSKAQSRQDESTSAVMRSLMAHIVLLVVASWNPEA
jgi:hypothetical protein